MDERDLPEAPRLQVMPSQLQVVEDLNIPASQDDILQKMQCNWCGGFHTTNCWAITEITFYPDGSPQALKLKDRPMIEQETIYDPAEILKHVAQ